MLQSTSLARFVNSDDWPGSIYEPPSLHKYVYVYNNPINNVDQSGQFATLQTVLFSVAIGAILGAIAGASYSMYYKKYTFGDPRFWRPVLIGMLIGAGVGVTAAEILAYKVGLIIFATGWRQAIIGIQVLGYKVMLHGSHHGKGIHFVIQQLSKSGTRWITILQETILRF